MLKTSNLSIKCGGEKCVSLLSLLTTVANQNDWQNEYVFYHKRKEIEILTTLGKSLNHLFINTSALNTLFFS
jgi:hypothetical protein